MTLEMGLGTFFLARDKKFNFNFNLTWTATQYWKTLGSMYITPIQTTRQK